MSRKVLSQSGISLADIYDVEGSIVGIDQLDVSEVKGVHELGATIHSERLVSWLVVGATGGIAQNTVFESVITNFPDSIARILGMSVFTDVAARVTHASVAIRNQDNDREIPIWVWDTADDREQGFEWSNDGAAVATFVHLSVLNPSMPQLLTRMGSNGLMSEVVLRGLTAGFGAGTVQTIVMLQIARPNPTLIPTPGEPSSHGLPIPGW